MYPSIRTSCKASRAPRPQYPLKPIDANTIMPCSVTLLDLTLSRALPSSPSRPSLKLSPAQQAFLDASQSSRRRSATELPPGAVRVKSEGEDVIAAVLAARGRGARLLEARKAGRILVRGGLRRTTEDGDV
ncbi:hypothetical protein GUITHDRAFT_115595 [Guillardia theta CCMP2712]|uniref:Uncharacterized protein n=1 Tax=Guillardia theta (strain CCMP2712) TaxID=905079 RepID=L1IPR7_GUITC|nr:hypothetical protein GUITHDRAFT_115595 [Guillardia theta CCMP2712]EKX38253.1 hypothetical protein GUITHDRAFT_115595 [Guillardia theta CCMP2712]|eukprot:XP_005825233.1 hypothetical protein GUITHDRAFT_115595 [Guillardia theta CCMP2712]